MAAQSIMDEEGYDPINQEKEIIVGDWLNQDLNNNLVIRYNNTNYLLSTARKTTCETSEMLNN